MSRNYVHKQQTPTTATHFITAFHSKVKLRMKRNDESRALATRAVIRANPSLHQKYLRQFNALSPERQAEIRDRQRV